MPAGSLRERKKAATRRQLMEVALRLFEAHGFEGTTVEQLAAAADVAPRTFFRYFPTKVDVLFADHVEQVALLREALAARSPDEPVLEAVRRASLEGVQKVASDPSLFLTRSRLVSSVPAALAHSRYLDTEFEELIADALASGSRTDSTSDLKVRVLARAAWSATRAARDVWVESEAEHDPRSLLDEAFDLLRGLDPER